MGVADDRCTFRQNGYRLADGWWCFNGRRDTYCPAQTQQADGDSSATNISSSQILSSSGGTAVTVGMQHAHAHGADDFSLLMFAALSASCATYILCGRT